MDKALTVALPPVRGKYDHDSTSQSAESRSGPAVTNDTTMTELSMSIEVKQQDLSVTSGERPPPSPVIDVSGHSPTIQKLSPEKKRKRSSKGSNKDCRYCIKTCKFNGKHKTKMIQCHICQIWAHFECVHEKDEDVVGLWTCHGCRHLARNMDKALCKMASLETSLKALQESNQLLVQLMKTQASESEQLQATNSALKLQVASLQEELKNSTSNAEVMSQLDRVTAEMVNINDRISQRQVPAEDKADTSPRKPAILIGDATIEGVHGVTTSGGKEVTVHVRPTATFSEISEELDRPGVKEGADEVFLVCGSREVGSEHSLEEVKDIFVDLVSKVKARCDRLTVSSVLPSAESNNRTIELNKLIQDVCSQLGATFVDNDRNFLFRDNNRDGAAFRGDTNVLTANGILRLLGNMNLAVPRLENSGHHGGVRNPRRRRNQSVQPQRHPGNRQPQELDDDDTQPRTNGSQQPPSQSARNPRRTHVRPENDGRRVRGTTVTVGDESRAGTGSRDDKESPDGAAYRYVPGQCNKCAETNHVTGRCRHNEKVLCRTYGQRGHKSKHHVSGRQHN